MGRLDGRCALITGASSDLGIATAVEFAKEGIKGLILQYYKNRDKVMSIKPKLEEYGCKVVVEKVDVSDFNSIKNLKDKIMRDFNRLDILIAYAGYPAEKNVWFADPLDMDEDILYRPWSVDLKGSYNCVRAFVKDMKRQGYGKIILTSSTPAIYGEPIGLAFTLAKASILALVKSLAPLLAPEVYINAIVLGSIATTPNLKNYTKEEMEKLCNNIPLKRFGRPDEVAKVAKFLASNDSDYITGQAIVVDGGEMRLA